MKNKYPHIFEPMTIRRMTVKNRIVMTPMGTNYGEQNGEMSFLHINYYEQRAKGGTGLLIVENASVDSPQGSNGTTQLRIDHDNYLEFQQALSDIGESLEARFALEDKLIALAVAHNLSNDVRDNIAPTA